MRRIKSLTGLLLLFSYSIPLLGQSEWTVQNDKDGIRISSRKDVKTSFDDIRVELDVPGKLAQLETIILDVNKYSQWICFTKKTLLVKQAKDYRRIYFTEMSVPWPFNNRYYYSDLTLDPDSVNHCFHVITKSIEGNECDTRGLVKITYTRGEWRVTRKSLNSLHIDYTLELDPGGNISPWLFNMFIVKGPRETFEKIRKKMTDLNQVQ
jgi:hypothetical protein